MTTIFSTKKTLKNRFSKRILGMEALESREMLSVNPLGVDNYSAPDFVQTNAATSQEFSTEADVGTVTLNPSVPVTYKTMGIEIKKASVANLTNIETYHLQYNATNATDGWTTYTVDQLIGNGSNSIDDDFTADLTGLAPNTTYKFRLNTLPTETDDTSVGNTVLTLDGTQATASLVWTITSGGLELDTNEANNELTINLSGLLIGTTYAISVVDNATDSYTIGAFGNPSNATGGTLSSLNFTATATSGSFKIKAANGLVPGAKVDVKLTAETDVTKDPITLIAATGPVLATPTTNSTSSASGVTSGAVTLTWTKPTKAESTDAGNPLVDAVVARYDKTVPATDYKITVSDGAGFNATYYSQGKTTLTITDLAPGKEYSYKVENKLTPKATSNVPTLVKGGDDYVVVTSGLFETAASTLADKMAVGRPTDVKTAATDTAVKITWKAPLNYTGGYEVTVKNLGVSATTGTFNVAAGAKTEATIKYGVEKLSGDLSGWYLTKDDRYEVVITPTSGNDSGTNGLASTTTNFVAAKTQKDQEPTVTAKIKPNAAPASGLIAITAGSKPDTVKVGLASGKSIADVGNDVEGFWIQLDDTSAPAAATDPDPAADGYTYVTKSELVTGVEITATGLTNVAAHVHAANSAGYELVGQGYTSTIAPTATTPVNTTLNPASAASVTGTVSGNKITVAWTNNNSVIGNATTGTLDYFATKYDVYVSRATGGPWVWIGEKTSLNASTADTTLKLDVTDLEYDTNYYFAVIATCNDAVPNGAKVAALKASSAVKTGTAPTIEAKNILTAKKVSEVKYETGDVKFKLEAFVAANGKTDPEQYYVVLRDANKAVIASKLLPTTTTGDVTLSSTDLGIVLTPKAKYTVEVFGVVGSGTDVKVSTTKASGSLSVADYPAATLKVTGGTKPTVNGVSITVTDKTVATDKFYYVQYTSVADAKGKADWSTATVEKLAAGNVSKNGGTPYPLATKLDPNTQYYVRIVTSDTDVKITTGTPNSWTIGTAPLDDWIDATTVVFGKEIKVKTAAVPLATVGKPGFGFNDTTYDMTLRTVGQTMLSAKGADAIFAGSNPSLPSATFTYKLLVSLDSKVDKVTGKLLGSAEINLGNGGSLSNGLKTEPYTAKGSTTTITDGQYTLEYALTGKDGILEALKITGSNASSLKNLNFQLVTIVEYGTSTTFESVTKPGKVAMPKWFV